MRRSHSPGVVRPPRVDFPAAGVGIALGLERLDYTIKTPEETTRERAHVGSASWIEAPVALGEFVQGAQSDHPTFERVQGSEARLVRNNAARVG